MKRGRVFHSPFFVLMILQNNGISKFSAVAPSKIAKTAVMRNKIRRRLYSVIAKIDTKTEGADVILISKKPVLEATTDQLEQEIRTIFVKGGLIK